MNLIDYWEGADYESAKKAYRKLQEKEERERKEAKFAKKVVVSLFGDEIIYGVYGSTVAFIGPDGDDYVRYGISIKKRGLFSMECFALSYREYTMKDGSCYKCYIEFPINKDVLREARRDGRSVLLRIVKDLDKRAKNKKVEEGGGKRKKLEKESEVTPLTTITSEEVEGVCNQIQSEVD